MAWSNTLATGNELKKNLAYNVAYQVLAIVLPLVTAPYVSRVLGAEGLGTYSYTYSIAYYFGLVGMLGVTNHGSRSIALVKGDKEKVSQAFSNIYAVQLASTFLALVVYLLFILTLFNGVKLIAVIDALFVLSYLLDINWLFFGIEQFKITVTRNTIIKVVTAVCIFLFVKTRTDLWLYTMIMASGTLLSQLYLWVSVRKFIDFRRPQLPKVLKNVKPILVLFIPAIAYSIYKILDKIMLGSMSDMTQVGLFNSAEQIINIPMSLITAFGTVMLPRISNLLVFNDKDTIEKYNTLSFKYFSIIVFASTFGLMGICAVLAPVYFGSEFVGSSPLIGGLSVSLIFMVWANIIRTQYLIPRQMDRPYGISTIVGALFNVVLNYVLIPGMGAFGSMLATVVAEFSVFFVQYCFVRDELNVFNMLRGGLPFFPLGVFMGLCVWGVGLQLGSSVHTLLVQLLVGALFYLFGSIVILAVQKDSLFLSVSKRLSAFHSH